MAALRKLEPGPLPLFVFVEKMFLSVPREMGTGLVLEEGLGLGVVVDEVADSQRSVECPFTVEPDAEALPAGVLVDIGGTLARLGPKSSPESQHVCSKEQPLV